MLPDSAHILVVDDNGLIRTTLKRHLESWGHRVSLAANGHEAMPWLKQDRPDVIVLDLFMPGMDGFETLYEITHGACRVPVLVMSGGGGATSHCDYLAMASRLGADRVLKKPFTASELVAAVEALLPAPGYGVSSAGRGSPPPAGPGNRAC